MKRIGWFGLLCLAEISCAATKSEMPARQADASERAPQGDPGLDRSTTLDTSTLARERLVLLKQEVARVSSRLEHEGTADQRAHWQDDLGDIAHDCTELSAELQQAEQMPAEERAAEHARLVPLIDVLYAVNARTTTAIDHSLDARASK